MNQQFHPSRLDSARSAILLRFRELNTAPNGLAKLSLFFEQMGQYRNGYFAAAMQHLANEHCIETAMTGFLRLTLEGYKAAHEQQM